MTEPLVTEPQPSRESSTAEALAALVVLFSVAEVQLAPLRARLGSRGTVNAVKNYLQELFTAALTPAWNLIRAAYRAGSQSVVNGPVRLEDTSFDAEVHGESARLLYENLAGRLQDATGYVGRRVEDEYRAASLESLLFSTIEEATTEGKATTLEANLRDRGIKAFRDKAGREWNLTSYVEMVARTTSSEAYSAGVVNRMAVNGLDVVRVSSHEHDTDVCTPFDGKTYSLSGSGYPQLEERPPFHPRCKHYLIAVGDGTKS